MKNAQKIMRENLPLSVGLVDAPPLVFELAVKIEAIHQKELNI